jgi:hypothetical protein
MDGYEKKMKERKKKIKFLGASKHLYNSLCWLVCWFVGPLVGLSVGPHIASPREISRLVCYTTCLLVVKKM